MSEVDSSKPIELYIRALPHVAAPKDSEKGPYLNEVDARYAGELMQDLNPDLYRLIRSSMGPEVYRIESDQGRVASSSDESVIMLNEIQLRGIVALSALTGAAIASLVIGKSLHEANELNQQMFGESDAA